MEETVSTGMELEVEAESQSIEGAVSRVADSTSAPEPHVDGSVNRADDEDEDEDERHGEDIPVEFCVVYNSGTKVDTLRLLDFKCVISEQLPNMPKPYIVRVVMDRNHRSICVVKQGRVIGGICFRPFHSQGFAEIVFLAITEQEKHKRYGTSVMNNLKEHVKKEGIQYFLTYADNTAIGYFRKQGFSKRKTMNKARWEGGWIKDYVRSTLMECRILQTVDYLDLETMYDKQRNAVKEKIKMLSKSHVVYPGLTHFKEHPGEALEIADIPGIKEAGWTPSRIRRRTGQVSELAGKMSLVLKALKKCSSAWPFLEPVSEEQAPDYFVVIKSPMDLGTMSKRLDEGYYDSKETFITDVELIVSNCKLFNAPETAYYKAAVGLQKRFRKLIPKLD